MKAARNIFAMPAATGSLRTLNAEFINKTLAKFKHWLDYPKRSRQTSRLQQMLAIRRERDHHENAVTAPPEDEYIDLCCMWAVEFYTPAHMDSLIKYAADLDRAARSTGPHVQTISSWLNDSTGHPFSSSWMDLGTWQPKGSIQRVFPLDREVDLPLAVSYATGRISSVSPSIVAVAVCFAFNDEFATRFDSALRADKTTYAVPHRGGATFFRPEKQKRDDIDLIRTQMSQRAASWFRQTIPGVFSEGLLGGQLPTCELLTLRKAEPFAAPEQFTYPDGQFMRIFGVHGDWNAWEDTRIRGLKFAVDCRSEGGPRFHSIVALNEQSWLRADMQMYGDEPRWGRVNFLSEMMPDMLSYWALWPLLIGYTEEITKIRNTVVSNIGKTTNVAKTLERVERRMAVLSDMEAIATDLAEVSLSQRTPWHIGRQFKACQPQLYPGNDTLLEMLVDSITERAKWLGITNQSVMEQLSQLGTMMAASENVRLQKAITWLTVAILLLTALSAALVATQITIPDWIKSILGQAWAILNR